MGLTVRRPNPGSGAWFFRIQKSRLALGLTALFSGVEWCNAKFKSEWTYTSNPLHVVMVLVGTTSASLPPPQYKYETPW
jgi:hypothetical protein